MALALIIRWRLLQLILLVTHLSACIDIEGKVVNGWTATDFVPYQASIRVAMRDFVIFGRGHTCGGVLISRKTVVTAAHCLYNGQVLRNFFELHVILGSMNRFHRTPETVIRPVSGVIAHPDYRRGLSFANDIGLLILRSQVEFSDFVNEISFIENQVTNEKNCQISGWGSLKYQGSMPADLQKANVSIVNQTFCNSTESYFGFIENGMICANGLNTNGLVIDVCQGDSGGPLTCNGKLVGLASFGMACGSTLYFPGVYSDVYFYRDWIYNNWSSATNIFQHQMMHILSVLLSISIQIFFLR